MTTAGQPRRRWKAVLLSLFVPGLGELYAGKPHSGAFTFVLIWFLLVAAIAALFTPLPVVAATLPFVIVLGTWVMIVRRAAKAAARAPQPYPLQPYNRWYWYLLAILVYAFVWQPSVVGFVRSRWGGAYRSPSAGMEPTLLAGDYFFVSRRPSARRPIRDGIVMLATPKYVLVVKRIVGLPGDTLSVTDGVLVRNGVRLAEPFVRLLDPRAEELNDGRAWQIAHLAGGNPHTYRPTTRNWGPILVPADSVFVLGDNRDNSYDSRFYGAVGIDRIRGRPLVVYFSVDPEADGLSVRWNRIGHRF